MPEDPNQAPQNQEVPAGQPYQPAAAPAPQTAEPTVSAPAQAPVTAQPGQPVVAGAPQPVATSKSKGLPLMIAGGVLVLIAIIASLFLTVFNKHISAKQVTDAQSAAKSMGNDVSSIASTLTSEDGPATEADFNSQIKDVQNKLSDAETQYAVLQKSKVLSDKPTDQKFMALSAKWSSYDTYVKNEVSDTQAIFPPIFQYVDSSTILSDNAPTTLAGLPTYLASFSGFVNTALTKLNAAKTVLPENQQGLNGIKAYLKAISGDVTTVQKDLAVGDYTAADSDLAKIDGEETSLDDTLSQADTQSNAHEEKLDPSTSISSFQSALDNLLTQVSPGSK